MVAAFLVFMSIKVSEVCVSRYQEEFRMVEDPAPFFLVESKSSSSDKSKSMNI